MAAKQNGDKVTATTKEKLDKMSAQLGEMQEALKRIEAHYVKQLQEAQKTQQHLITAGSRGEVKEVKSVKLSTEQADRIVQNMQGQFAQLLASRSGDSVILAKRSDDSVIVSRSVSFEAEEK